MEYHGNIMGISWEYHGHMISVNMRKILGGSSQLSILQRGKGLFMGKSTWGNQG